MPRTRSVSAHRKVLAAALNLVAERGFEATSMDAIADASGVSKATIYKHWRDKDTLLLEVLAEAHGLHSRPAFDSGDTRADILAVLSYRPPEHTDMRERLMPHFMAYSARNASFAPAWREMVMEPPRQELCQLLKRAIDDGQINPDIDMDLALTLLLGPMMYWYIFLRRKSGDPSRLASGVVESFWRAFGQPSAETSTQRESAARNG